jgi:hypothetical protein
MDVAHSFVLRSFEGLTCDFWAKNAKEKCKNKNKGNKSVASPFGLRSCLRQSGRPLCGWLDAGLKERAKAEALAYLDAKRPQLQRQKQQQIPTG